MKTTYLPALAALLLVACAQQSADQNPGPAEEATAVEPTTPQRTMGEPFKTPLPQGVVLIQPHNATMDIQQENPNGTIGRRVEFEYLEGDSAQAMREFSDAMASAGFVTADGPSNENGVIRQAFKKPGYGSVFARSQAQDPARRKHEDAIGFVVVAWPEGEGRAAVPPGGQ